MSGPDERGPDDPPGGVYETHRQPRVFFEWPGLIDEETSNVIEDFWVADETLDTASQLLCNPEPNVTQMMMMCNPVRDHPGGTGWHRDVHPVDMAPMDALAADLTENGPRYTQWNVPLYDDNVLWVVPGSHRRRNTEGENAELHADAESAGLHRHRGRAEGRRRRNLQQLPHPHGEQLHDKDAAHPPRRSRDIRRLP